MSFLMQRKRGKVMTRIRIKMKLIRLIHSAS
nr:MAG TPA: hypothetical protein [Caudoviricetes sp.]